MFIEGIGIGGYRSFGAELQTIGPLSKINLIVGQNNSGKSNILRFAHEHYGRTVRRVGRGQTDPLGFLPLDAHLPQPCSVRFAVAVQRTDALNDGLAQQFQNRGVVADPLNQVLDCLSDDQQMMWFYFIAPSIDANKWEFDSDWINELVQRHPAPDRWRVVSEVLTNRAAGASSDNAANVVQLLLQHYEVPSVALVPAVRQIGTDSLRDGDYTGIDIIQRLADFQHPSISDQHKQERFDAITEFVQTVLDEPSALIEIPVQQDTIHVRLGSQKLPLEHLGTGIHEVTMLAAWATMLNDHVVCIEEPELHLHPLLQKKLLRYLAERTTNQYLITTHSAHILDHPDAAIFHVRWDGSQSIVHRAETSADRVRICSDLGYRPADLLQTNAIIWVEGPSDRIYVRHWLQAVDPSLIEGIHYSLMFYGGRLLSHLSASDPEIDDFISLRHINQQLAIVIDSDKTSPQKPINETKKRVRDEFNQGPGFAWVTKGREIENYVPTELVLDAVREVHPTAMELASSGQYEHVLPFLIRNGKTVTDVDKVKVAHFATARPADLSPLDLQVNINRLVRFIHEANGLKQPGT